MTAQTEIGHLIKVDTFMVNRDQVMDHETLHVYNFQTASPTPKSLSL